MTIKTILQQKGSKVFSVGPETTLGDVARELSERRIGAGVILDGERLIGILSERDVGRRVGKRGADALSETVGEVMTRKVEVCSMDDSIGSVMSRMTESRFRHMPVMDGDTMEGLISIGDVVKARLSELAMEKDALEGMIKGF